MDITQTRYKYAALLVFLIPPMTTPSLQVVVKSLTEVQEEKCQLAALHKG